VAVIPAELTALLVTGGMFAIWGVIGVENALLET
jgi:hypothetical protein